jgi:hypothetical protein
MMSSYYTLHGVAEKPFTVCSLKLFSVEEFVFFVFFTSFSCFFLLSSSSFCLPLKVSNSSDEVMVTVLWPRCAQLKYTQEMSHCCFDNIDADTKEWCQQPIKSAPDIDMIDLFLAVKEWFVTLTCRSAQTICEARQVSHHSTLNCTCPAEGECSSTIMYISTWPTRSSRMKTAS